MQANETGEQPDGGPGVPLGVKAIKTTPLLTLDEGVEAMKKGGKSGYKPPK